MMSDEHAQNFPILFAAHRRQKVLAQAIDALQSAVATEQIRKVLFDQLKERINRASETAWNNHIAEPYFHAGKWQEQSRELNALYASLNAPQIHTSSGFLKKIDRSGLEGEIIKKMRDLGAEFERLARPMNGLKEHIVKGCAPKAAPPATTNPDKVVGTCSCCFRGIAVKPDQKMAHHGYTRPGWGVQTSSCSGVRFKPLEQSTEGLEWHIEQTEAYRDHITNLLSNPEKITKIPVRNPKGSHLPPVIITAEHPRWDNAKSNFIREKEYELSAVIYEIEKLAGELTKWAKFHGMSKPQSAPNAPECDQESFKEISF